MFRNFIIVTLRNVNRHLGYTMLNISGLSIGLATAIFIFLWVMDEVNVDAFHKNNGSLYKIFHNSPYTDGHIETYGTTSAAFADPIRSEIPEVEYVVRTDWGNQVIVQHDQTSFMEQALCVDRDFFNMFSFPIIAGNKVDPILNGNETAISKRMAEKFFPNGDAIGKVIRVEEKYDLKINAVFDNVPERSTLKFDVIIPFETYLKDRDWMRTWGNSSIQTFVKLRSDATVSNVDAKLQAIMKKNCEGCPVVPFLHPFKDMYLYGGFDNGKPSGGRIEYVKAFSAVAIFILIIACINFMNLATARSATRSREVGVRKIVGAQRSSLIFQFMSESIVISLIALIIAITLVEVLLPMFNLLIEKNISLELSDPRILFPLIGIALITGIIAGSYPSLFLSSFKAIKVLKRNPQSLSSGAGLRKVLVVFQFAISVVLITASIIVHQQIEYIRNKNLGFDRSNVITMPIRPGIEKNIDAFKTEALRHPGVISVTTSGHNPFDVHNVTTDPIWPGKRADEVLPFKVIICDADFIPTLGMTILEGRNFQSETWADTVNYLVNEAAAKSMRLDKPVGTPLEMWYGKGEIIGVVKDFHNEDFRGSIDPLIFAFYPSNSWRVFIKLDNQNISEALQHLSSIYKKFDQVYPFEYAFLDKQFEDQYRNEATTGKLALSFMVIAIFISSLGLFGLASFTAERRTKEIGVRKVLGASVPNLVAMLCSDFTKLVLISLIIGCPIGYLVMQKFLSQYTFHTDLTLWIFVITAAAILVISLLTVIFQASKAALSNPVNSLRSE